MNSQFPSSNPFRRKTTAIPEAPSVIGQNAAPISNNTDISRVKPIRKVRLQSPPPSSPEAISTAQRPLSPIPPISTIDDERQIDPFGSPDHEVPDDTPDNEPNNVPPNPFAKTLENLEPVEALTTGISTRAQSKTTAGRASLDVDAFKRLMTMGSPGLVPNSGTPRHSSYHGPGHVPDGTSTETSSVSRQSIFESLQEVHNESPRTSHELSEQEIDRFSVVQDFSTGRKKPPPPNSRHGKLIKMELRDDPMKEPSRPSSSSSKVSQQLSYLSSSPLTRSQTDLNKPLPAAPRHPSTDLSHDERESIFDKEAAGKIPEPPSPTVSISKKAPPPPPITRRHSQLVSKSRNRSESGGRLSPKPEEVLSSPLSPESGRERSSSNSSSIAPTPPPARRPASLRSPSFVPSISTPSIASVENAVTSPRITSPPPPPPPRSLSTRKVNRPASIISMESQKELQKRSNAPPPPPPRQKGSSLDSIDNSVISVRRSIDSSRGASDVLKPPETTEPENIIPPKSPDILADLSALQREVEAAMAQQKKVC